jgi:hypothetical protein
LGVRHLYSIASGAAQTSLSFIPAARPASISAQAQVTCPILVAGWVDGRERKWTKSDLDFLRRDLGVESIDLPMLLRHPIKEMAEGVRDGKISFFSMCNSLQTLVHCHMQQHMDFGFKALVKYE